MRAGGKWFYRFPTMRTWIFLNRVFQHNKARLTVAAKAIQPKTQRHSSGGVSWVRKKPDELNSLPVFFRFDLFYDLFANGILSISKPN